MNPVQKNSTQPSGSVGFAYRKQKKRDRRSFFSHTLAEIAAATTSVAAYHPLRTVATQLSAGTPLQWKLSVLYRGFLGSALGAHQLFLMSALERQLSSLFFRRRDEQPAVWQQFLSGAAAGLLTAPTVTPLDMVVVQRQLNRKFALFEPSKLYRGFWPVAFRQAGLGAGMFILPNLMTHKFRERFPDQAAKHEKKVKIVMGFLGGFFTATATQFFEVARLRMQEDIGREKYPTTWSAFKSVPQQLFSARGIKMYGARLSVVAVATVVMNNSREFFYHWAVKEEK